MFVLVNDVPTKPFLMQRGLRQGDLLSHFLFVLDAEVLNKLFEKAKECNFIESLVIGSKRVELSHLQIMDDTLLFGPAKENVLINYKRTLDGFG